MPLLQDQRRLARAARAQFRMRLVRGNPAPLRHIVTVGVRLPEDKASRAARRGIRARCVLEGRMTIAALFVDRLGAYAGLPDVDLWDETRDARLYPGPHPVVAHPPCSRWCRLAGLVEARWGHKKGDDGGCFASALESVRRWGGVLEHPAHSDAWIAFGLSEPPRGGGWLGTLCGGAVCNVEQGRYGHPAKKAT